MLDRQGRLLLPEEICAPINLSGELLLAGALDCFEIWSPENWTAHCETVKPAYEQVAELVGL